VHVALDDELTARTAASFCRVIDDVLGARGRIVIAADTVKKVDAAGLAVLVQASRQASRCGAELSVVASAELHRALLDSALLDDVPITSARAVAPGDTIRIVAGAVPDELDALIATPEMTLRVPAWDDLASFDRWAVEPLLDQMVGSRLLYRCRHLAAHDADFVAEVTANPTALTALIVPAQTGRPVGFVRLYQIDLVEGFAFLETAVADVRALRRGWGVLASRLLLCWAMDVLGLHRVEAKVYAYNALSVNALTRNGFVREGRLRSAREYDGRRWDLLVFGILHEEMVAQRTRHDVPPTRLWSLSATDP
jgi:RimJ/RimL family protein N-acetyltransferase/ABC-type transporter Mla MlaB component